MAAQLFFWPSDFVADHPSAYAASPICTFTGYLQGKPTHAVPYLKATFISTF